MQGHNSSEPHVRISVFPRDSRFPTEAWIAIVPSYKKGKQAIYAQSSVGHLRTPSVSDGKGGKRLPLRPAGSAHRASMMHDREPRLWMKMGTPLSCFPRSTENSCSLQIGEGETSNTGEEMTIGRSRATTFSGILKTRDRINAPTADTICKIWYNAEASKSTKMFQTLSRQLAAELRVQSQAAPSRMISSNMSYTSRRGRLKPTGTTLISS